MKQFIILLTLTLFGFMATGCANQSGSVLSEDPFQGSDPFQVASQGSNSESTDHASRVTDSTSSKPHSGWNRAQEEYGNSASPKSTEPAGFASTGSGLRFQSSAPIPEIYAEKRPASPQQTVPPQTVSRPDVSGQVQNAQYFNGESERQQIMQTGGLKSEMPIVTPRNSASSQEPVATLDQPVFVEEEQSVEPQSKPSTEEKAWWSQ